MIYDYSFVAWPDNRFPREVFTLFECLKTRVEITHTEEDFNHFRAKLNDYGITLREVERRPHHEPERIQ